MINDNDYVYSFTPRSIDGPHFVAETEEDLDGMLGGFVGAEQCDGCGNSVYHIECGKKRGFVAVCAMDPSDDPEFQHTEPCGARYPITLSLAGKTVF